ncbi:hypothetical protein OROHE_009212 [Orobanche hederae]
MAGDLCRFNFRKYASEYPHQPEERTVFQPASASLWSLDQIKSSANREELECWRVPPSDVSFHVPADDEPV